MCAPLCWGSPQKETGSKSVVTSQAAAWDKTASSPEDSGKTGKECLELLHFRRGLVTHCGLSLCCPLPLSLVGHGAIKTFEFNIPETEASITSTVLKSDFCPCCCKWEMPAAGCSRHAKKVLG